ncbi:MAG: transglycosylase domain-containing protein [Flavobacteriales bacterium]|nr:transglycosylase domain-containing protein [Flavobacteriales bacterium]
MRRKKQRRPGNGLALAKFFLSLIGAVMVAFAVLVIMVEQGLFGDLPSKEELAHIRQEEASLVLAADGTIIGKFFAKERTNIRMDDVPEHLIAALVSIEDARFFSHQGVDGASYLRVLFRTILGRDRSGGGGSTISQQLVKNLYGRGSHGPLTMPVNKTKEALLAYRLEQVYSKEEVLLLYLNSVPFGENLFGIEAAAQRFFGKPARSLDVQEGAVLIGMLKANTTYNPRLHPEAARSRRNVVLRAMSEQGHLDLAELQRLQALPIELNYRGTDAFDLYGYFNAQVEHEATAILEGLTKSDGDSHDLRTDGLRIHTTLEPDLQRLAARSAAGHLQRVQPALDKELAGRRDRKRWELQLPANERHAGAVRAMRELYDHGGLRVNSITRLDSLWHYHKLLHGAVLLMDPASGDVKAWVGGGHFRYLPYDLVHAKRGAASTIKPILYAAALEGGMEPCTYLDNRPRNYPEWNDWSPQNYAPDSLGGEVPLWYALTRSLNLPTVDLYFRTGPETLARVFERMGLPTAALEHPAVALGAVDVSLWQLVSAYSVFANTGQRAEPRTIDRITDASGKVIYQAKAPRKHQVLDRGTATTITAMLQRAVDEGTGSPLRTRFGVRSELAGKTGTGQEHSDAWFMVYTKDLVLGIWVGAMDPSVHFRSSAGSGSQLALPIAGGILKEMERSSSLRRMYLTDRPNRTDMDCPSWRKYNGLRHFMDGLGKQGPEARKPVKDYTRPDHPTPPKKKKGFFDRLFRNKED